MTKKSKDIKLDKEFEQAIAEQQAAEKVGLDTEQILEKDIPPMERLDLPEEKEMDWRPRNDYVILKSTIKKEVLDADSKKRYPHDDFDFIVHLTGGRVKDLEVGEEVFVQYPYLNYINEDNMRWHSTRDRYFYVNELDLRLTK